MALRTGSIKPSLKTELWFPKAETTEGKKTKKKNARKKEIRSMFYY